MQAPNPFIGNVPDGIHANPYYRKVIYTSEYIQLVYMTLQPLQEIGEEEHYNDQYIRVEFGKARVILEGGKIIEILNEGDVVIIPGGMLHEVINMSSDQYLRISVIYSPPKYSPYD